MKPLASVCDRAVGIGIGALILFTPLAYGSVNNWAVVILETAIFALAALWLTGRALENRGSARTGLEIPILLFLGMTLFQLVPLPRSVLSVVSPRIAAVYDRTVPGFGRGRAEQFED